MHARSLLSVRLHVLAATTWIGGLSFLVLVVVPWLRHGGREQAAEKLRRQASVLGRVNALLGLLLLALAVMLVRGTPW